MCITALYYYYDTGQPKLMRLLKFSAKVNSTVGYILQGKKYCIAFLSTFKIDRFFLSVSVNFAASHKL